MNIVLLSVLTFVGTALMTRVVVRNAGTLGLVQAPNHRSSHVLPTPTGGGLGMVVAVSLMGIWLAVTEGLSLYPMLLALPLAVVGLWDDRGDQPAWLRFGIQVIVITGLVTLLGDLPVPDLPLPRDLLGGMMYLALVVSGVWWINLFNFMDGIDGIAAVQAASMAAVAAILIAWQNPAAMDQPLWLFLWCLVAGTLGFLLLNWSPARIFMGDVGSTWLAFSLFAIALLTVQHGWLSYGCWMVLASVFVIDASVTLVVRMWRGERWYQAHRSHAYQRLSRRWPGGRQSGHRGVSLLVLAVNAAWLAPLAAAMETLPAYGWLWLGLAWLPLVVVMLYLGAGMPDDGRDS